MKNPDVNDTLRADGTDAVRERHDRAYSNGRNREMPQPPPEILPPPYKPMQVARAFVAHSLLVDGIPDKPTLRYWRGGWWVWRTSHWVEVANRTVRSLLYTFTEHAVYVHTFKGMQVTTP